jgi:PIN domain nuclease of toxin-antitoxin system
LKLLLDTNALLWTRAGSARLTEVQRSAMAHADSLLVSVVSAWEIASLLRLRRIELEESISKTIQGPGWDVLGIRLDHVERLAELPMLHRDPFDRMLIAQALVEQCDVVTADRRFAQYGVTVVGA